MGTPLAYLLTWTCYGSWLPGDDRCWVDDAHNSYGSPVLRPDPIVKGRSVARMRSAPVLLCDRDRPIVQKAIEDHSAIRGWTLSAVNVRTNHVHVVVGAPGYAPEVVMGQFKMWATRRLRDAAVVSDDRVWTR